MRNIIREADEVINSDRPSKYGPVTESYQKIADILNAITTEHEREIFTPQLVCKVLIAMKLVRDSYSPENPDHLRDMIGYIGLLDQLRLSDDEELVGDDLLGALGKLKDDLEAAGYDVGPWEKNSVDEVFHKKNFPGLKGNADQEQGEHPVDSYEYDQEDDSLGRCEPEDMADCDGYCQECKQYRG